MLSQWSLEYNYERDVPPLIVTQCHRDPVIYPPASLDIYIENSLLTSRAQLTLLTLVTVGSVTTVCNKMIAPGHDCVSH